MAPWANNCNTKTSISIHGISCKPELMWKQGSASTAGTASAPTPCKQLHTTVLEGRGDRPQTSLHCTNSADNSHCGLPDKISHCWDMTVFHSIPNPHTGHIYWVWSGTSQRPSLHCHCNGVAVVRPLIQSWRPLASGALTLSQPLGIGILLLHFTKVFGSRTSGPCQGLVVSVSGQVREGLTRGGGGVAGLLRSCDRQWCPTLVR